MNIVSLSYFISQYHEYLSISISLSLSLSLYLYLKSKSLNILIYQFIDLAGSVNFFVLALTGLLGCHRTAPFIPFRSMLLVGMVSVWAMRLGGFQFVRLWNKRRAGRFEAIRGDLKKFAAFWLLQAAWIFVVSLPLTLVNAAGASDNFKARGFGFFDVIGCLIWAFGFCFEVLADHEKYLFSLTPRNERTLPFITTGLWSFTRHPNYFGEMVLWTGFWLSAVQGIRSWSLLAALVAIISPIFTFYLLMFVSGIPVAEAHDDRRYSKLLAYQQYKAITSPLFPVSPKIYIYIHPRIKRSFFFERNTVQMPNQVPKFKTGAPIQFSTQTLR